MTYTPSAEEVDAAAREQWRQEHGRISSHDSVRTPESDERESAESGYRIWDRGLVSGAVKDGYRRRAIAALIAAHAARAEVGEGLALDIAHISTAIDSSYPDDLDAETRRWRRCMKVVEEAGEVTEALLGVVGENPRKGTTHDLADVRRELLDVALASLGAVAHLDDNVTDVVFDLGEHASTVLGRLRALDTSRGTL